MNSSRMHRAWFLGVASCLLATSCAPVELGPVSVPMLAVDTTWSMSFFGVDPTAVTTAYDPPGIVETVEIVEAENSAEVRIRATAEGSTSLTVSAHGLDSTGEVQVATPTTVEASYRGWLNLIPYDEFYAPEGATLQFGKPYMTNGEQALLGDGGWDAVGTGQVEVHDENEDGFRVTVHGSGELHIDTAGDDPRFRVELASEEDASSFSLLEQEGSPWACVEANRLGGGLILGLPAFWRHAGGDELGTGTCLKTPASGTEGASYERVDVTIGNVTRSEQVYFDPTDVLLE